MVLDSSIWCDTGKLFKKRDDWVEESRTTIPLRLAWAWTIHKYQGQTIQNNIVLTLGNKEMAHGPTYVAISRATQVSNIGICGGLTFARISSKLADMKKMRVKNIEDQRLAAIAEETYHIL